MISVKEENGKLKVHIECEDKLDLMAQTVCVITSCVRQIRDAEGDKEAIDAYWKILYSALLVLRGTHDIDVVKDEDEEEEHQTSNPVDGLNSLIGQALGHIDYDDGGTIDDLPKF